MTDFEKFSIRCAAIWIGLTIGNFGVNLVIHLVANATPCTQVWWARANVATIYQTIAILSVWLWELLSKRRASTGTSALWDGQRCV